MPPLTIVSADAALKDIYKQEYFNDVCYKDRPLLALMPKFTKFGGRQMPIVLEYGNPTGISQVFATAQFNAQPSRFEDFLLDRTHYYGIAQIDGETADAMENDTYAFVRGMESQARGILNQIARTLHIFLYRNGSGIRGTVLAGTGTNTLTLTNPQDAQLFEVGMTIDGCTGAGAPHGTPDRISAINRQAGTLVSTAATWNAAILNGDNLFVEGDYTAAGSLNCVAGLDAWVPAAAPAAALFFGVNRTQDVDRLGGLRLNAALAGWPIEEALIRGAFEVDAYEGRLTHYMLHPDNYADLVNALGAKSNYQRVEVMSTHKGTKGYIGFAGVLIDGPKGQIVCVSDNACQIDVAWGLTMPTWVCASLGTAPKFINTKDGNMWLRQNNADGLEIRGGYYANCGCKAPGKNIRIAL